MGIVDSDSFGVDILILFEGISIFSLFFVFKKFIGVDLFIFGFRVLEFKGRVWGKFLLLVVVRFMRVILLVLVNVG